MPEPLTIRERVIEAFFATLQTVGDDIKVERAADDAVALPPNGAFKARVVLHSGGQRKGVITGGEAEINSLTSYVLRLTVACYLAEKTNEDVDKAVSWVYGRVLSTMLADPYLGGAAQWLVEADDALEDPDWDRVRTHTPNAAVRLHFEAEFVTARRDPYSPG